MRVSGDLALFNRQRAKTVNLRLFRRFVTGVLTNLIPGRIYELTIHLVRAAEMEAANREHLGHAGTTDVITLDYCEPDVLAGEIFICVDEAIIQARRFRTTWQAEVARYAVHGILHLKGFDDLRPAARQNMKRREDSIMRALERRFDLRKLGSDRKLKA